MTRDEFNQFCAAKVATSHVVQWGGADVWKVGGKVFAIGGWGPKRDDGSEMPAYVFKTSDLNFDFLSHSQGYRPAPYMASRGMKWIQQIDDSPEKDEALTYYLNESYRLVSLGLTKKLQRELGLNQVPD
ncbi:MmcQ/YjbR family DNA-binding protein [Motilimonas sp. KMU-193]|uniref:MmcQ/YjbR family DNA-binding protein n=1 Tax=Motilimonas sp. KMU-193 TaxID=3388668 RepID=UPI00396B3A70